MNDLIVGLGLVLVIEGAAYALFPATFRKLSAAMFQQSDSSLRQMGLIAAVIGFFIVWLVRG